MFGAVAVRRRVTAMSKFRDESNQQREDIVAWFRSTPGIIISVAVLALFGGWLGVQFVIDLIGQGAAG